MRLEHDRTKVGDGYDLRIRRVAVVPDMRLLVSDLDEVDTIARSAIRMLARAAMVYDDARHILGHQQRIVVVCYYKAVRVLPQGHGHVCLIRSEHAMRKRMLELVVVAGHAADHTNLVRPAAYVQQRSWQHGVLLLAP